MPRRKSYINSDARKNRPSLSLTEYEETFGPPGEEIIELAADETPLIEPIWEMQRQINEEEDQYQMFLVYASLPPAQRSVKKVAELWSGEIYEKKEDIPSRIRYASYRMSWQRRAAAWDMHRLTEVNADWLTRDSDRRNADYEAALLLREVAIERIKLIQAEELTIKTAIQLLKVASELQSNSIPNSTFNSEEVKQLVSGLPEERRKNVIAILLAKYGE